MRVIILSVIIVALAGVGFQLFRLYGQQKDLSERFGTKQGEFAALIEESKKIEADIDYFANPLNLSKELRSKFNYKKPGEKLIIVVPKQ